MPAHVILVADRDPLQRQLIDLLLAEDRYLVVGVESGKQALEYVRENTPDLAILDLDLGDVTGADVCEKMKSVTRLNPVPVVLTTPSRGGAGLDAHTKSLVHFVAADLVLQKPLGDKNLRERVGALLTGEASRASGNDEALHSTQVIEAAIRSIEEQPVVATDPPPAEAVAANPEIEALQERIEDLERQLVKTTSAGSIGRGSRLPLKVQAELDRLRERVEEQDRIIEELKRRNDLLVEAIEEEKRNAAAQRGLFGRRRSF
jgi:DNA-binding response OmpR family regulator